MADRTRDKVEKLKNDFQKFRRSGVDDKLQSLREILDRQAALINQLIPLPPGPDRDSLLDALDDLIVQASTISFDEELVILGGIVEQLKHIGPLPVVAGTIVGRMSFVIEEGLPPELSHLDNGVLAAGSLVVLQLPEDWRLTAPATVSSDNLILNITGNTNGSNLLVIRVVSERSPKPDDTIIVRFNGILVGTRMGNVSGKLAVFPGRVSEQEFFVLPPASVR